MSEAESGGGIGRVALRVGLCVALVAVGVVGMAVLAAMKKPPAEAQPRERALRVESMVVRAEDVPVVISGYGEVRALNVVRLSPEVAGTVVAVHARLETGEVIARGETLFRIDPRDYEAAAAEAAAAAAQWRHTISRLRRQLEIDQERLKNLERNRALAKADFDRVKGLLDDNRVGTRAGVEVAERAYNTAADMADQLARGVALYPVQILEAESSQQSARARKMRADTNLARCEVRAAFAARVKSVDLETGQYVTPGMPVLTLADDAVLEIHVPLDSHDARRWLRFASPSVAPGPGWFDKLEPVTCTIRWTEDPAGHVWQGRLHRVVAFNRQTRTLTVAVRAGGAGGRAGAPGGLPLVEGMFAAVEIPGRGLEQVFRLPRWAVTLDNTVYLSVSNRLATVPVTLARAAGDEALVGEGLSDGDVVITTRLIDPLEGILLDLGADSEGAPQS